MTRKTLIETDGKSAPIPAMATYISADDPILLRRTGWEIGDDVHDRFSDCISTDNGRTWSESVSRPACSVQKVEGGYLAHTENAALYLPRTDTLLHVTNDKFETDVGHVNLDGKAQVRLTHGRPDAVAASEAGCQVVISDFGKKQGLTVSFCNPILDRRGRVLLPLNWQKEDADGALRAAGHAARGDLPAVLRDYWECGLLTGEPDGAGGYSWSLGPAIPFDTALTTRGLCEGALAELSNGDLAMVLRGSNAGRHDLTGCKWLSRSADGGVTWSRAEPLTYDDGSAVESGACGSALFRSAFNGKLYWLGNPCAQGRRAIANGPRTPLALIEVREEPFALKRETTQVIDRAPEDNPSVQHSNFKFYEDRETGELVVFLTRYGENGNEGMDWMRANLYEYRVQFL